MEFFADLFVLSTEQDFAECVAVGGEEAAGVFGDGEELGAGEFVGGCLVVGAAVEAPDPGFGSAEDLLSVGADNHLASGVEGANAGEGALCFASLVGNEADREGAGLSVDPFVEGAAHAAAAVIINFDGLNVFGQCHDLSLSLLSVITESNETARRIVSLWGIFGISRL